MKTLIALTAAALVSACHTGNLPVRRADDAVTRICPSVPTHIRQTTLGITELLDLANQSSISGDSQGYTRQLSLATQYAQELGRLGVMDDICLQKGQYDGMIRSGLDPLSARTRSMGSIQTFSDRLLAKPIPGNDPSAVATTTAWMDAWEGL